MPSSPTQRPRFGDVNAAGARASLAGGAVVVFFPFAIIGSLLCVMFEVRGLAAAVIVGLAGLSGALVAIRYGVNVGNVAGQLLARFVAPSGSTTPYEYGFSYQQALEAKGDVVGALESYEALLRDSPSNVEAHVHAAELCAKRGNVARAVELFRALRSVPGVTSARDIYASQRLVDLYRGPARDDGRALVELRRMVERYPGTDTAARAREALGRIKAGGG